MVMKMKKILSFVLVIAILLCSVTAYADQAIDYPISVHIDQGDITVRLPENAIYVTQESTVNDLYFLIAGAESYPLIMNDLKSNSVYIDAINMNYSWELRIAVQQGAPMDFKGLSESVAQIYLDAFVSDFTNRGLTIDVTFVCTASGHAFVGLRANMGGRNIYTIMTTSDDKLLAITTGDVYAGSIDMDELKSVTMAIINGIIFD